ncbi:Hypothetical predicted protein [Podarcis lilfordi]|uniref:Uncharacterized protein n=1 Tax=Podarcis lilfordi TaxID=74358 RepID=A0AA35JLM9_9SAUR|nr:Hypothetical predicted protein [Podarcis lilfordi]
MCPTFPLPGPSVARSTREDKERIPRRAYVPIITSEEILEIQGEKIGIMFEIAKMETRKETKEQPPKETPDTRHHSRESGLSRLVCSKGSPIVLGTWKERNKSSLNSGPKPWKAQEERWGVREAALKKGRKWLLPFSLSELAPCLLRYVRGNRVGFLSV